MIELHARAAHRAAQRARSRANIGVCYGRRHHHIGRKSQLSSGTRLLLIVADDTASHIVPPNHYRHYHFVGRSSWLLFFTGVCSALVLPPVEQQEVIIRGLHPSESERSKSVQSRLELKWQSN